MRVTAAAAALSGEASAAHCAAYAAATSHSHPPMPASAATAGRRRAPSSGAAAIPAACLRAGRAASSRRGCRCGRCNLLSRSGFVGDRADDVARLHAMAVADFDADRFPSRCRARRAARCPCAGARRRGRSPAVPRCERRRDRRAARVRGALRRVRAKLVRRSGLRPSPAPSSSGVLPCSSLASAAAISTAGTLCSRS